MAWLKIFIFSILVMVFGVVGMDASLQIVQMPFSLLLTLLIGLQSLALLSWLLAIDGSVSKPLQWVKEKLNPFISRLKPKADDVIDERNDAFKVLSHKQKIEALRKKYAVEPQEFKSKLRLSWLLISGVISFLILIFLWLNKPDSIDGRAFAAVIALLVGAPVALLVWYFRDQNNLSELKRQHLDTNLKQFQQLQEWATGNIKDGYNEDGSLKQHAETLQISALHQLRPFLKGAYGEEFKRGAFEIYTSVLKTEHQKILKLFEEQNVPLTFDKIQKAINGVPLAKQINQIAAEEWFCLLVNHDFPTAGISLVGTDLMDSYLAKLSFINADFTGACLMNVSFDKCRLDGVNLSNVLMPLASCKAAKMHKANLQNSILPGVCFKNSNLEEANFTSALVGRAFLNGVYEGITDFDCANLEKANLEGVNLEGMNREELNLDNANIKNVKF